MSPSERTLFEAFLKPARTYLEFGTGGSTVLASKLVARWVISVDSSEEWLGKVRDACAASDVGVTPMLFPVDVGPVGDWGRPTDATTRDRWPSYHEAVWTLPGSTESELYMVDGRFRVACFMQVILRCRPGAIVLIHDFDDRPHYQVVRETTREIARSEKLSAFVAEPGLNRARAHEVLAEHRYDWR